MKSIELPDASETTIPLNPVASPSKDNSTNVPQLAGITPPVILKPRTVEPPEEIINPLDVASPPDASRTVAPSTVNWNPAIASDE